VQEVIQFALYLMKSGTDIADEMLAEYNAAHPEAPLDREFGEICIIYDRRGMTRKNFDHRLFGIMKKVRPTSPMARAIHH
jgi:hypothetical protein